MQFFLSMMNVSFFKRKRGTDGNKKQEMEEEEIMLK